MLSLLQTKRQTYPRQKKSASLTQIRLCFSCSRNNPYHKQTKKRKPTSFTFALTGGVSALTPLYNVIPITNEKIDVSSSKKNPLVLRRYVYVSPVHEITSITKKRKKRKPTLFTYALTGGVSALTPVYNVIPITNKKIDVSTSKKIRQSYVDPSMFLLFTK